MTSANLVITALADENAALASQLVAYRMLLHEALSQLHDRQDDVARLECQLQALREDLRRFVLSKVA